jgi:DNA modification methylase
MKLIKGDCLEVLPTVPNLKMIMADPPDNIGLKYGQYKDRLKKSDYVSLLEKWVDAFCSAAPIVWVSFNAKWTIEMGCIAQRMQEKHKVEVKPCLQVYTFGQHNHHDLGNHHRPLWRFRAKGAKLYPDQIRVPSWRLIHGDKRADSRGRVPGDVFDFPRVTGNSKQRRAWHPTQLHEDLVERCVKLSTREGDRVLDPFAGTGTTLRVCKRINRHCTLIEMDETYCRNISAEHGLIVNDPLNSRATLGRILAASSQAL